MIKWLIVFLAMIIVDGLWAAYIVVTAKKDALKAASLSTIITLLSCVVVIEYNRNPELLIPVGLGAFIGTYIMVKFLKKRDLTK